MPKLIPVTTKQIDSILENSLDMHVHVAPDPLWDRRFNTYQCAKECQRVGMAGFVAKSYYYPTTTECLITSELVDGVTAFGSVTIGYSTTGGLEGAPDVLRRHAEMGCRVVWFPAGDASACSQYMWNRDRGISILNDAGRIRDEAVEVLHIAKEHEMVVCKGHMSFEETWALFERAADLGITKLVDTHPLSDAWKPLAIEQIRQLSALGAYTELVFGNLMPRLGSYDPAQYVELIHDIGADKCILSTDWGQAVDPSPAEGMRFFIGTMLQYGCTEDELLWMVRANPSELLGLFPEDLDLPCADEEVEPPHHPF